MPQEVDEIKDLISLVIDMVNLGPVVARKGGLSMSDITAIWEVLENIGPACKGIDQLPANFSDIDVEDFTEIIEFVMAELNLASNSAEAVVEKSLMAVKACYEVYLEVRS